MFNMVVADDETVERKGILKLIEKYEIPLDAVEAVNGREALEHIRNQHVDVLLTDIKMPFMNGLELARVAREVNPPLKVIIFSAHGEFDYAKEAVALDVVHYLLKPIIVNEFVEVMTKVIQLCRDEEARSKREDEQAENFRKLQNYENERFLLDMMHHSDDTPKSNRRAINEVMAYIEDHYNHDISLESISNKVYLSPGYLSALFKKETGQSLSKYITSFRLEKAKELLRETNMKIIDVAKNTGFSDASYFCSVFKSYNGMSPASYKEMSG